MLESSSDSGPLAVIFDCDGVLLDSNRLKTDCFRQTVQRFGFAENDVERFVAFQQANFGMSRYRVFDALLAWELERRPEVGQPDLVQGYVEILRERYVHAAATPGMAEAIADLRCPLFVVSGSDEAELRELFAQRGLAGWFRRIYGSPATKEQNIARVLDELGAPVPDRVVFVGDAEADYRAASALGVRFVYMDDYSAAQPRMRALALEAGFPTIQDLTGFAPLVQGWAVNHWAGEPILQ